MKRLERELRGLGRIPPPRGEAVERAVAAARRELHARQARPISYFEFILEQLRTVRKRWWLLQAAVLALLWCVIATPTQMPELRRLVHASMPLFVLCAAPELWKNVRSGSTEVECAACFSLREVYSARMTMFAAVDLTLLSAFCALALARGHIAVTALISELLLPFTVSCCICFRVLCSRRCRSEAFAMALCMVYTLLWSGIVLRPELYERVSLPVWCALLALCAAWLAWCVRRTLNSSTKWSDPIWS